MPRPVQVRSKIAFLIYLVLLAGCSTRPAFHGISHDPIVQRALRFQGVPYRYGGATPRGFDCSGLVQYVYKEEGIFIPRTTGLQWQQAKKVADSELSPGDLLFFRLPGRRLHVGIYIGHDQFIHAPSRGKTVRIDPLGPYWRRHYFGAGRYRH